VIELVDDAIHQNVFGDAARAVQLRLLMEEKMKLRHTLTI
jgi:hypothetical protein